LSNFSLNPKFFGSFSQNVSFSVSDFKNTIEVFHARTWLLKQFEIEVFIFSWF
jgi:hypothetical protein